MNKLKRYTIIGIIFVLITGTISHFVYEWSGNNVLVGFCFPINESVWEHMKLVFFPMLLYSFYMISKLDSDYPSIASTAMFGVLLGTLLIPIIFYTYSGILGYTTGFFDIGTFVVSVLLSFWFIYKLAASRKLAPYEAAFKTLVLVMAMSFFLFTYQPPDVGIFADNSHSAR